MDKLVLKAGPLSLVVFISFPQHPFDFLVSHSSYFHHAFSFVGFFFFKILFIYF